MIAAEKALDADALQILQHSLGLDRYGQGPRFRNHFVAGGHDLTVCRDLASLGLMVEHPASDLTGGSPWFNVSSLGIVAVEQQSPRPPSPPPASSSQKRYLDYLRADAGYNFAEFLGIDLPRLEHGRMDKVRYTSSRGTGEWCGTKQAAKASYKQDMATRKALGHVSFRSEF